MKIVVISDTHGAKFSHLIPKCDLLLHCGDISPARMAHDHHSQKQWFHNSFIDQLKEVKAKNIVVIAGNHDTYLHNCYGFGPNAAEIEKALPKNVHYLADSGAEIDGLKIYGTPWVNAPIWSDLGPPVWNFAAKNQDKLADIYSKIPEGLHILLSHGPAYGYCDVILDNGMQLLKQESLGPNYIVQEDNLGAVPLIEQIRLVKPQYVFSGHIHSAKHDWEVIVDKDSLKPITKFRCVSLLNEQYDVGYEPFVIEL